MITLGLEEEVFITEPLLPTTRSLYYLSRLLWQNPRRNYKLTASNFARGNDLKYGMMSGLEIATGICNSSDQLISELRELRQQLSKVAEGHIVPLGHLLQIDTPTNVCALQVHLGGFEDIDKAYDNIAWYLPALILVLANAPMRNLERWGQSYRLAVGYATGPLTGDRRYRYQDLIISKRLGTIEIRAFDPVSCASRIKFVVDALVAVSQLPDRKPLDLERYKRLRNQAITKGIDSELKDLILEINQYSPLPLELVENTQADSTVRMYEKNGLLGAYKKLDELYRQDAFEMPKRSPFVAKFLQPAAGFLGYYAVKFPYITAKWLKEK